MCSGHGECICGVCNCFTLGPDTARRYSREHCECNDYSCPRSDDDASLCGGESLCVCCVSVSVCVCVCMGGCVGMGVSVGGGGGVCVHV